MRRALAVTNTLLLGCSWLAALLGTYVSLLTGLLPALAVSILCCWTILTWVVYRFACSTARQTAWRRALPALFFALSSTCFNYAFTFFNRKPNPELGFPHRYYPLDRKDNGPRPSAR